MAASIQGYIGLFAIIGATVLGCYLFYHAHKWVSTARHAIQEMKPTTAPVPRAPEIKKQLGFEFCAKRELPSIDMLLKDAKENGQVWVMGRDCSHWLNGFRERIEEYVRVRKLSFTFLLAAQGTQSIQLAEDAKLISRQSPEARNDCVETFNSIRKSLGNNADKLRLGIYDLPPVHSIVVIDADTEDEQIVVNHYLYDIDPLERPSLILKKTHLPDQLRVVFAQYHRSICHAMRNAKDEEGKPLETEPKRTYLKLGFQSQVSRDLLEIEPQLNFKDAKPIHFKSWNETEVDLKKQLIDNETVYGIVENIAKLLNEWNKDLERASLLMLEPDSRIYLYIQSCKKHYEKLREIGFLS